MNALTLLICIASVPTVWAERKIVDLSHTLNSRSHRWPTNKPFELTVVANGTTPAGYWYASNDVSFAEHTGTHLDAPAHFASKPGIYYASTIPVERLVGPVCLINLAEKAKENRDYLVTPADVTGWEDKYGSIAPGSIVLFDFGWSQYWDSYEQVFGSTSTNTTTFHFPGIGLEAAKLLGSRKIYGVGIDTPSLDYGPSQSFETHVHLLGENIYFLENVGDMSGLPAGGKGVTLVVGVMKIEGGSGGPARLIAMFDDDVNDGSAATRLAASWSLAMLMLLSRTLTCWL